MKLTVTCLLSLNTCYDYDYDQFLRRSVTLCDDGIQNNCIRTSTTDCRVHKHLMCDGVMDCPDGSDETHDMCKKRTGRFQFSLQTSIPAESWKSWNTCSMDNG